MQMKLILEPISKLSLALFLRLLTLSFVALLAQIPSGYELRKAPWLKSKFLKNHSNLILKWVLGTLVFTTTLSGHTQVVSKTSVECPDSVRKICDQTFIKEMGSKLFESCLKFEKSAGTKRIYTNGETRFDFSVRYSFSIPGVAGTNINLQMLYAVHSGKGHLQSGMFLRFDHTDLPSNFQEKGIKIISYSQAESIAFAADSTIIDKSNATAEHFVLYPESFYWNFTTYYPEPNPQGDAEQIITHTILIDPYTGKIVADFIQ